MKDNNDTNLKGRSNYFAWIKRFEILARINNWGKFENGVFIPTSDLKSNEAFKWIINNINDSAILSIDSSETLSDNLDRLNKYYGNGYANANRVSRISNSNHMN